MSNTFQLAFTAGPRQGESVPLADDEVMLGRSKANHIVVADPAVSRLHLMFHVTDNGVILDAAESVGGTQLNEKPLLGQVPLNHGDVIRLGDSSFQFLVFSKTDAYGNAEDLFTDPEEVARRFGRPKGLADTQRMDNIPMGGSTFGAVPTPVSSGGQAIDLSAPSVAPENGLGRWMWLWAVLAAFVGGGLMFLLLNR